MDTRRLLAVGVRVALQRASTSMMLVGDGSGPFGRRIPRDDLLPRLPDRRVPAADAAGRRRSPPAWRRCSASRAPRPARCCGGSRPRDSIERGEQKEAMLTAAGRERAEQVVRKHRIIERLLTDFMGYTAAEAHVHADELGGHVHRRDDRPRSREARPPRPLPARLAGRHRRSSRPRTGSWRRWPSSSRARGADDRAPRRARRRLCTGSTTRASSRARGRGARGAAGGRAVHGARSTARAGDRPRRPPPASSCGRCLGRRGLRRSRCAGGLRGARRPCRCAPT